MTATPGTERRERLLYLRGASTAVQTVLDGMPLLRPQRSNALRVWNAVCQHLRLMLERIDVERDEIRGQRLPHETIVRNRIMNPQLVGFMNWLRDVEVQEAVRGRLYAANKHQALDWTKTIMEATAEYLKEAAIVERDRG